VIPRGRGAASGCELCARADRQHAAVLAATISSACTVTIRRAYETEGGRFVIRVRLKEQTGHREDVELPAVPRVGDLIHRPSGPELKVVSVHWSVDPEVSADVVLLVVPSTTEDYR
jgi:hypothetical protein